MFAWLDLNPDYAPEMNIGAQKNATFISSKFECLQKGFCLAFAATIICHNDELSSSFTYSVQMSGLKDENTEWE